LRLSAKQQAEMFLEYSEVDKKKVRYYGQDYSPALPKEGDLNYELTRRRAIPDTYCVRPDYASYVLNLRADVCKKEMLLDDGRLSQTYWQPEPLYPTNTIMRQLQQGIVKYGCRQAAIPAIYKDFVKNQKTDFLEHFLHLALGVVFLDDYHGFKFKDADEVEEIRKKNIEKGKKEGLIWGGLYWNSTIFPLPRHYVDTDTGNYTATEPSAGEIYCKMVGELSELGFEECMRDLNFFKKAAKRNKKQQKKSQTLFDMGFTPKKE